MRMTDESMALQDIKTLVKAFKQINKVIDITALAATGNMQMLLLRLPVIIRKIQNKEIDLEFLSTDLLNILQKPEYNEI